MKNKLVILLLSMSFFLSGCWDKVELENRGFVNAIGFDKYKEDSKDKSEIKVENSTNNRYSISMSLPSLESIIGSKSEEAENKSVKTAIGKTVTGAMTLVDLSSSQKLYYGHTKVAVIDKEILSDEKLFREAIDALERNHEINRKILMVTTEDGAKEIVSAKSKGEPLLGIYLTNFYKNNSDTIALSIKQDLQGVISQLRTSSVTIIPKITLKDKELKLGGAAVVSNYKLVDWIDEKQTKGQLWFENKVKGSTLLTDYENTPIPMKITSSRINKQFIDNGNGLELIFYADASGSIEEYIFSNNKDFDQTKLEKLGKQYEDVITNDIRDIFNYYYKDLGVDGLHLEEYMRKHNYDVYLKYKDDIQAALRDCTLKTSVAVKIESTGTIK